MAGEEAAPIAVAVEEAAEQVTEAVSEAVTEPASIPDDLSVLAWQDLRAFYELVLGEKPGGQMRRADVEAAIRQARQEEADQ